MHYCHDCYAYVCSKHWIQKYDCHDCDSSCGIDDCTFDYPNPLGGVDVEPGTGIFCRNCRWVFHSTCFIIHGCKLQCDICKKEDGIFKCECCRYYCTNCTSKYNVNFCNQCDYKF